MRKTIATVKLSSVEEAELKALVSKGKHSVRRVKRERILLESFSGKKPEVIAQEVEVSVATVYNIHKRYEQQGLQVALAEKPRSGQPRKVTPQVEATATQIACSPAPEGRTRWTVRLINEKLITLGYELEDESVGLILKSKLKPWLKKRWCIGKIDGQYLANMEDVLNVYDWQLDAKTARLCFDERPCQLLGGSDKCPTHESGESQKRRQ